MTQKDTYNLVIVGHIDHGKSSITSRLLLETNSIPKGKLEQIRSQCESKGKKFEPSFLLDSLKEEREKLITIEGTRLTFSTEKRIYKIVDAPGHTEFLKNMLTGASRAEGAILIVDALSGIMENTVRHLNLLSFLQIPNVIVAVNKMDQVDWDQATFVRIATKLADLGQKVGISISQFVPCSALIGINISSNIGHCDWYKGPSVLEQIELLPSPVKQINEKLRFGVQDVIGDSQIVGWCYQGQIKSGDDVCFLQSGKRARIQKILGFPEPKEDIYPNQAGAFKISEEFLPVRGEVVVSALDKSVTVGKIWKIKIILLSPEPIFLNKQYILKSGFMKSHITVAEISNVFDSGTMEVKSNLHGVWQNQIAQLTVSSDLNLAIDLNSHSNVNRRLVLVDNYNICAAGFFDMSETVIAKSEVCLDLNQG